MKGEEQEQPARDGVGPSTGRRPASGQGLMGCSCREARAGLLGSAWFWSSQLDHVRVCRTLANMRLKSG